MLKRGTNITRRLLISVHVDIVLQKVMVPTPAFQKLLHRLMDMNKDKDSGSKSNGNVPLYKSILKLTVSDFMVVYILCCT